MNYVPISERIHISFFGQTNSGKSSLINAITGQNISIVSDNEGTTTDPVSKTMELLPLGPVLITDTAGYNDFTELGKLRLKKTYQILKKTNIALLTADASIGLQNEDYNFIKLFNKHNIKYIIVYNKSDLIQIPSTISENEIYVSAKNNTNVEELKAKICSIFGIENENKKLVGDLIKENDKIILVTPIDKSAPKARLILPVQMVIRDILDHNAISVVIKENQLEKTIKEIKNPKLIITDSQVFKYVNSLLPKEIALTSFSILFARYKGILKTALEGINHIEKIENNDYILISEGCTHHRQCEDIGTVKLPKWIKEFTKKEINFEFTQGVDFPANLKKYKMIIHCGGCMLNEKEILNRYNEAIKQNVKITNYGILIAHLNGILKRSIELFNF